MFRPWRLSVCLLAGCAFGPAAPAPPPRVADPPAPQPAATVEPQAAEPAPEVGAEGEPPAAADAPAEDDPEAADPELERTEEPKGTPASRYAALDRDACEAELRKRSIAFERVDTARGVIAPVRLAGPLSGVTFRSNLPASKRKTAVIEIYDCRLVLALDDFAKILAKHDVVEVVHLSVYRPVSRKRKLAGAGRRHGGALAIDAAIFRTSDGRTLDVKRDFHGRIGARTCPPPAQATELRLIACEAGDARLFNVLLTPDYNWAHRNHFHLEVTAKGRGLYLR